MLRKFEERNFLKQGEEGSLSITLPLSNNTVASGDLSCNPNPTKKSCDTKGGCHRRKQKNSKACQAPSSVTDDDDSKENNDPQQTIPQVEVEYVPEPAELDDGMDEEFRKIFSKFSFCETTETQDSDNKDESAENAASTMKADSDSVLEEQDNPQKERISVFIFQLQRRMKIAELKQIFSRPDVVEGKCGIEKRPFQLPNFFFCGNMN
ncbi:hypothetical protein CMV_010360 [Castanea mollissima]|uniref:Uncharacterized protein n=1 Tax=Castanea mollissima TaxID=60419 RepID=A0A8J4R7H0_9ROSI|nr:hypothetical protein CMV_010360 [Castanea mollissima]